MNLETFERLWRANARDLSHTAQAYLMEDMMQTLNRRRASQSAFFLFLTAVLGAITFIFGYGVIKHNNFDPAHEWGAIAMLLTPWIALILMKRAFERHVRRFPDPAASLPEQLSAQLDENRMKQQKAVIMFGLMGLFPIATGIALWQLLSVGKMEVAHVQQGALLFGSVLGISLVIQIVRYLRVLRPEGKRLKRLLGEYEA
ncbi:hypothetical protein [Asticcacaulis sp. YBE204]|uniref:hypothetical protein n=1 Tax=Asticcacaulis sp. YBE204 TaxID=1282363 RepID=UPI0003C401DC|nr:hypothetical protein [Asticcacaulis sp. YBE204]ESQ77939.1 hypothetical protein AEYBE204_15700 [Asticcacaulis sp. YBE204]